MNLSATGQLLAQRDAFGDTLVELIDRDERVYVLDGDLANSTKADKVSRERADVESLAARNRDGGHGPLVCHQFQPIDTNWPWGKITRLLLPRQGVGSSATHLDGAEGGRALHDISDELPEGGFNGSSIRWLGDLNDLRFALHVVRIGSDGQIDFGFIALVSRHDLLK